MAPNAPSRRKRKNNSASTGLDSGSTATADLEAIVFGRALPTLPEQTCEGDEANDGLEADDVESLLPLAAGDGHDQSKKSASPKPKAKRKRKRSKGDDVAVGLQTVAWTDHDDATLEADLSIRNRTRKLRRSDAETKVAGNEYERRLREQFMKLHGSASWAERRVGDDHEARASSDSEDEKEPEPTATSAVPVAQSSSGGLRPHQLDIKCRQRVEIPSLASSERAAVVQSLQFHPDSELMLTAGLDKTIRFFSVDGTENSKVASYFFKKFPIMGAKFTPDGDHVLVTGRGIAMWSLDVRTGQAMRLRQQTSNHLTSRYRRLDVGPCPLDEPALRSNKMYSVLGDDGEVVVFDVPSNQPVRTLRMGMPAVASVFSTEKDVLFSADEDSNIYEWDLATGRCTQRVKAAWAVGIESLALRRASTHAATPLLAVGTVSGNIDMYDLSEPKMSAKPTSSVSNLTTMVTSLKFHPAGELLIGASKFKKESLKVVHCATSTVFQNWPTQKTPLNRVTSVDFSRQGGFLAMANEKGKVLLYSLRHYEKLK